MLCALWLGLTALLPARPASSEGSADPAPEPAGERRVFALPTPLGDIEYGAGRGLRLGDTGLHIGAFTTFEFDREADEDGEAALDGLNFLLLWQPVDAFRAFAELEVDDLFSYDLEEDETDSDPGLEVERLYGDLIWDDALAARFGIFQTPVGRWNLVPTEPFVWTAVEPVQVETAFDERQAGPALFGSWHLPGGSLDYWLYGQVVDPLTESNDPEPIDHSVGGRLAFGSASEGWSVGSSLLASERDGDWSVLGGLDAEWLWGPAHFTTEFLIQEGDLEEREQWSVYLQGVVEVLPTLYLVGRFEHFDPSGSSADANLGDLGAAWVPWEFVRLKATYRFADEQSEAVRRGVFASLAVVF